MFSDNKNQKIITRANRGKKSMNDFFFQKKEAVLYSTVINQYGNRRGKILISPKQNKTK